MPADQSDSPKNAPIRSVADYAGEMEGLYADAITRQATEPEVPR